MKAKNLFKSLIVAVLLVPFMLVLTACGDKDEETATEPEEKFTPIAATEIYEPFRAAMVSFNDEETEPPKKFTLNQRLSMEKFFYQGAFSGSFKMEYNIYCGADLENKDMFELITEKESQMGMSYSTTGVVFTKDVEGAKRLYGYMTSLGEPTQRKYADFPIVAQEGGISWEEQFAQFGINTQLNNAEESGYVKLEISLETAIDDFKQAIVNKINEDYQSTGQDFSIGLENVAFSGKTYEDGRVGFVITIKQDLPAEDLLMDNAEGTATTVRTMEFIYKDDEIVEVRASAQINQPDGRKYMSVSLSQKINRGVYDTSVIQTYMNDAKVNATKYELDPYLPNEY